MDNHEVTAQFLAAHPLPFPQGEVDKDARGRVTVIGGHREVPGAVLIAGEAALRAGAGKVQIMTVKSTAIALSIAMPEARVIGLSENAVGDIDPSNAGGMTSSIQSNEAVLIGPGMLDDDAGGRLATTLLDALYGPSFVLDAAALTGLRDQQSVLKRQGGRTVITPHAGEMATFLGMDRDDVLGDPVAAARRAAAVTGSVVVMKGSHTHIVSPQGEIWHSRHGNVGLATSGSGDSLAGIITGLLARGAAPLLAAQWAVFMHGEAGDRLGKRVGPLGFLARDIPAEIPAIMRDLAAAV
jgi:ADP-dependent NAD(P)H-hydrate dehydratase